MILPNFPGNQAQNVYLGKWVISKAAPATCLITQIRRILYISTEVLTASSSSHLHNSPEVSIELVFISAFYK